jgi:hypothetical protein
MIRLGDQPARVMMGPVRSVVQNLIAIVLGTLLFLGLLWVMWKLGMSPDGSERP